MLANTNPQLKSNIWKIALSNVLYDIGFINAIYILFFQFLGFTFSDIGIFEAVTSITIVIIDLPSGSIADSIGRRWAVFIANIFMLMMVMLLSLSSGGITVILIAGILSGLEFSFKSGANTALLYDTLKHLDREEDFLKVSGRLNAFSLISRLSGMIIGGFLFAFNPRLPYWVWAIFIGFSLIFLVLIKEPIKTNLKYNLKTLFSDMKESLRFIFKNKKLIWLVIFFLLADVFAESYWDVYSQAHLNSAGLLPRDFGFIFAIFTGLSAVASFYINKVEKKLGEKWSLYLIILVHGFIFFALAFFNFWIVLVIILIFFTINREFGWLIRESYTNKLIPSANRASILSAISFLYNGLFGGAVIIWLFGLSLDIIGGFFTLLLSGVLIF